MGQLQNEEQLQKIFTNINDWLKFAEAKNFGLLTLNVAIVFGLSQTDFDKDSLVMLVSFYFFAPLALIASLLSLISLMPILSAIESGTHLKGFLSRIANFIGKESPFENIHFYGYLRMIDVNTFIDKFHLKTDSNKIFTEYEKELVLQILYNSRITWLKYQFFKIAGFITLLGIMVSPILLLIFKMLVYYNNS